MPQVPARWLASLEGRRPEADEILQCLRRGNQAEGTPWSEAQLVQTMDCLTAMSEGPVPSSSSRSLWLRIPLVSARWVQMMARPLEVLTKGWVLVGLALWGLVVPLLPLTRQNSGFLSHGDWFAAAILFLVGALLHELGHAAALSAQGYPAGGIGVGMLFVIPVLHNDVSAISMLCTRGKLRVDLAGMVLQAAYGAVLLLLATGFSSQAPFLSLAVRMTYAAVCWNLIPFIRADGYWALCDALGFQDLDRVAPVGISRPKLIFKLIHRVLNIVFLGMVAVVLPVMWAGRLTAVLPAGWGPWSSVIIPGLVLLLWGFMGKRIYHLIGLLVVEAGRKCTISSAAAPKATANPWALPGSKE